MQQKINFREVRGIGEVINVTFDFIKQNFTGLFKSIAFIAGPFLFIASIFYGIFQSNLLFAMGNLKSANPQNPFAGLDAMKGMGGFGVFWLLASFFFFATVYEYLNLYINGTSQKIEVTNVWTAIKKHIGLYIRTLIGLIGMFFIYLIFVGIAMFILVITAAATGAIGVFVGVLLMFGMFFFIITPLIFLFNVRIFERLKFFKALSKSYALISGNWIKTIALLFIAFLFQFVLSFVFALPNTIVTIFSMHSLLDENYKILFLISNSLLIIVSYLLGSIIIVMVTFHYFNLVEKKEAVGLMGKINSIGSAQPSQPKDEETY